VKTVSERLIQQTTAFREDARSWPEVNVLSSPERNVMPCRRQD
jgi:hypothetical protein